MKIVWDEPKRAANLDKHGLDFADVTDAIFDSGIVRPSERGRFKVIGYVGDVAAAMIFKPLGSEAVLVISLRPASRKERRSL